MWGRCGGEMCGSGVVFVGECVEMVCGCFIRGSRTVQGPHQKSKAQVKTNVNGLYRDLATTFI